MNSKRAFSLTELLTVVAIMALIGAIGMPAMQSLRSARLSTSGNRLADLVNQARQNAITRNIQTALVMVTDVSDTGLNNRLFCLVEYHPAAQSWGMVSPWTLLPAEVMIDSAASDVFIKNSPALSTAIGNLKYGSTTITSGHYTYQVFLSDGTMDSSQIPANSPPVLRLVQNRAANQANYYDIILNVYTGIPKIERP